MAVSFKTPIICVFIAVFVAVVSAAPAAPADCSSVILNMADCLSYVTLTGTAQKPEGRCCAGLKTVITTKPDCLCESFKNSAKLGVTLNMSKALGLPAACQVIVPNASNCGVSVGTGAAPAVPAVSPTPATGAPTTTTTEATNAPAAHAPTPASSGSSALATSVVLTAVATVASALF
ncbi:hypothetical protein BUALT_Bualt15G0072300 [Buddleja alternifolia]|uniref:Bifunctional inhibitor/plant lipid transfer protein/seed storage helical domain-containing protein n=1 Tax=Buddleja alternifolia TaxID=168488 RepID=A0AAV6WF60_9LAMI|nr:hypothetical protein BUALT_Bualt15G0072300 [Buddleja alternifolia]